MSAADHFLDIKNYRWLIAASELIGDWDSEVALPNFNLRMNMNFIVVLRENTFTAFTAKHKMVPSQSIIDKRFILAPSSKALFDTSIRRFFYNLRQSMEIDQAAVDATRDLAQNITMEVIEQLEVHRNGFSYSDVFNQNAREMLRFMRFVILMLTAQALESIPKSRRKEVEPGSFLDNFITMKFDEFLIHRGYRLVEILLFEDHRNFSNFLRVDFRKFAELRDSISDVQFNWGDGNIDPSTVFQEYELGAGFVDNIYNYHIRDNNPAGGFMCLLEKRWILEILRDATLSLEQISDRLDKFYGYRPTALLWTLALMIRCGFIGSDLQDGVMRYFSERHGIYVVDVLSKKMAYIEHVFHHILLPLGILEDCSNCVKYQDLENWPYAAIVNCYVFVQ